MRPTWRTIVAVIGACAVLCGFAFKVGAWVERVDTSDKSNQAIDAMSVKVGDIDARLGRVEADVHRLTERADLHEKTVAAMP